MSETVPASALQIGFKPLFGLGRGCYDMIPPLIASGFFVADTVIIPEE